MKDLTKDAYLGLRARLGMRRSTWPTVGMIGLGALMWTAAALLLQRRETATYMLAQAVLGLAFFNAFALLHECAHGTAFRSHRLNEIVGHVASLGCGLPFYAWRHQHRQHHVWTGNVDKDPALRALKSFRARGVPHAVRAAWRTWIPLLAAVQHFVFLAYPFKVWRTAGLPMREKLRLALSIVWMLGGYLILGCVAPPALKLTTVLPAILVFLVLEELVNLPHHLDVPSFERKLPVWEQYRATRSCAHPRVVASLFFWNFNYHIEHHLFPSLPWYRLGQARGLLKGELGAAYLESKGFAWNFSRRGHDVQRVIEPRTASSLTWRNLST